MYGFNFQLWAKLYFASSSTHLGISSTFYKRNALMCYIWTSINQKKLMENSKKIPAKIEVEVYFYINDDGKIQFDIDEMTAEFESKLNQLETLND